jgi:hypothetical protein
MNADSFYWRLSAFIGGYSISLYFLGVLGGWLFQLVVLWAAMTGGRQNRNRLRFLLRLPEA